MSFYVHAQTKLRIDQLEEKVCISAPSHHAHIDNADIPTVALELLKAAGQESVIVPKATGTSHPVWTRNRASELTAIAEAAAREAVEKAEAEAAEKKLQERRDALARDLSGDDILRYEHIRSSLRKAIDRIIELEDGASHD